MAFGHRHKFLRCFGRRFNHTLAVGLILIQVAAGPLHASPVPAAVHGASSAVAIAGLLEICTGQGLVRLAAGDLPADWPAPTDRSAPSCPVCTAMGAAHLLGLPETPVLPVLAGWTEPPTISTRLELRSNLIPAAHPPRGPPSLV
jgi:hypothetical protein